MAKKKLTAWILVLAMVLSMFGGMTTAAFAGEEESPGVEPVAVTGVALDKETIELEVGQTDLLTATVSPEDATNSKITWQSSNGDVATVENGTVTAVELGTATITVTTEDGEFSDKCEVTVKSPGEAGDNPKSVTVEVNLCHNGLPIIGNDENKTAIACIPFTVEYFDLKDYGLEQYYRYEADSFENGGEYIEGGKVVKEPTLLHLFIKLLEEYYLEGESKLEIGNEALKISGSAKSLFMQNFWGYSGNLNYYVNHKYPEMSAGWGATADYILLNDGDIIDLGHFDYANFWQDGAFVYFDNPVETVKVGGEASFTLKTIPGMMGETPVPADLCICYAKTADPVNDPSFTLVDSVTDSSKPFKISFNESGTYYVMALDPLMGTEDAKNAPAVAKIVVGEESQLTGVCLYTDNNDLSTTFFKDNFDSEVKSYTLPDGYDVDDCVRYVISASQEGSTVTALGGQQITPKEVIVEGTDGETWRNWIRLNPGKNSFAFTVTPKEETSFIRTKYTFSRNLLPTLDNLEISSDGKLIYLDKKFDAKTSQYAITIPNNLSTLDISATPKGETYKIKYDGEETSSVNIEGKDRIEIEVTVGTGDEVVTNTYVVDFNKVEVYNAQIVADSENAVVSLYDSYKTPIKSEGGTFKNLMKGSLYSYVVSQYGYVTAVGTFDGPEDLTEGQVNVTLSKAPEPTTPLPDYTGDWINSRGNAENMGITDAETVIREKYANLKWAKKYGTGWAAAPTPPILVNGEIYIAANGKILRLDKQTGEVIAENVISGSLGFSLVTLTYGNGMIFVPVSDRIQAFRADTLESLWISEEIEGQTNSPITYHDGYVYSGTWNSEVKVGTYFGICVTDEDPTNTKEEKKCSWKLNHKGGFYWAGSYATDNYLVVGSDDGTREGDYTANGVLYSIEPKTGVVIDTIEGIKGDIRSSVSYDKKTDSLYCTTKGGKFIKAQVDENGEFKDDEFKILELGGMSTGTPLVYEGMAFLGVSGPAQFGTEGHNYKVIDTSKMEVIKDIPTKGYVQTSALLSTAYVEQTGKVYVYITYNQKPGGIDMLEYDLKTKESSSKALFIPSAAQSQYCICSLVCDADGTIYYKNDSCYLMAVEKFPKDLKVTSTTTTDFENGKDANFKFSVENISTGAIENAHMLTVLYDKDTNKMITYNFVTKNLASNETCNWGSMLPIPSKGRYKVKAFIWDAIENPKSLSNAVEVLMQ